MPRIAYIFGCLECAEGYSFECIRGVRELNESLLSAMLHCWRDYHDTRDCPVPEEHTAIIREIDGVRMRIARASG